MCKATEYVGYCIEVIFKAEVFAGVTKFKFKIIKIHRMLYMVNMEVKAIGEEKFWQISQCICVIHFVNIVKETFGK